VATAIAYSVNGVPIRLTDERWGHIVRRHPFMTGYRDDCLDVIENPDLVLRGQRGALIAVRGYGRKGYLAVFYKEISAQDGFVLTAHLIPRLPRRQTVWQP